MRPICDQPDSTGRFNPRCQHMLGDAKKAAAAERASRPRQCRRAAERAADRCNQHISKGTRA